MEFESRIATPGDFWKAISCRATGVAIVTTASPDGTVGFLALSATHLTASPPTMMVSLGKSTSAAAELIRNSTFCINYLEKSQKPLAEMFFSKDAPKGADRFRDVRQDSLTTGAPALTGCVGVLDCAVEDVIERHETLIVLAHLIDARSDGTAQPLLSYAGKMS